MPQPNRLSIGFAPEGIERLRALTESLESTQREVISALLELPDETIKAQIEQYRKDQAILKESQREAKKILQKSLRKNISPEKLEEIKRILEQK